MRVRVGARRPVTARRPRSPGTPCAPAPRRDCFRSQRRDGSAGRRESPRARRLRGWGRTSPGYGAAGGWRTTDGNRCRPSAPHSRMRHRTADLLRSRPASARWGSWRKTYYECPPEFYPVFALKSSLPRLILGRTVDRGNLAARHPEVNGELPAMVDHVVQHLPEKILPAHIAHLLWCRIELDRRTQLSIIHVADRVGHFLEDALHFADGAMPRIGHCGHVCGRKLELALHRLRGGDAFECKRPRQLLGAAAGGVGLHGFLPTGVGAQDLHRRGCLPFPGVQKRLFLAHELSSLSRPVICHIGGRLRVPAGIPAGMRSPWSPWAKTRPST